MPSSLYCSSDCSAVNRKLLSSVLSNVNRLLCYHWELRQQKGRRHQIPCPGRIYGGGHKARYTKSVQTGSPSAPCIQVKSPAGSSLSGDTLKKLLYGILLLGTHRLLIKMYCKKSNIMVRDDKIFHLILSYSSGCVYSAL